MTTHDWPVIWAGPEWRAEVSAWIGDVLHAKGCRITGPIEQPRIQFWSTQLVVPSDRGRVWLKQNNAGQSFEAALVARLAELAPGRVVEPIAVDHERGLLLSPDQGPTLRERDGGTAADWTGVLAEFGALQRQLSPYAAEIAATGRPGLRARDTPAYVEQRIDELARLGGGDPRGLSREDAAAATMALPELVDACTELDPSGIPDSLQHNDLHDDNAFPSVAGAAEVLRFRRRRVKPPVRRAAHRERVDGASARHDARRSARRAGRRCLSGELERPGAA